MVHNDWEHVKNTIFWVFKAIIFPLKRNGFSLQPWHKQRFLPIPSYLKIQLPSEESEKQASWLCTHMCCTCAVQTREWTSLKESGRSSISVLWTETWPFCKGLLMLQRVSQRAIPTTETSPFQVQSVFILSAIFRMSLFDEKKTTKKRSPWPYLDNFFLSQINSILLDIVLHRTLT